jgi:hypothetical protein
MLVVSAAEEGEATVKYCPSCCALALSHPSIGRLDSLRNDFAGQAKCFLASKRGLLSWQFFVLARF